MAARLPWILPIILSSAMPHCSSADLGTETSLGPAPQLIRFPPEPPGQPETQRNDGLAVNTQNRAAVVQFYMTYFEGTKNVPAQWTGSIPACNPGNVDAAYQTATVNRVNYYRAMAGLPGNVTLRQDLSAKCDDMAVMISANGVISHAPPPTWLCWTQDGFDAAQWSNLARGIDGARAIEGYMEDHGIGNEAVGHRRWVLYPRTTTLGTGDAPTGVTSPPQANTLWVIVPEDFGPRPGTPEWVAWPPSGYVPHQIINPQFGSTSRWSFSLFQADFSGAVVTMTREGVNIPVTTLPLADGFGDATLVWEPSQTDFTTAEDTNYSISITNVIDRHGATRSFDYAVTIIDPFAAGTGSPTGWVGQ